MVEISGQKTSRRPTTARRWQIVARGLVLPVVLLLGWSALVHFGIIRSRLLVPLNDVLMVPFTDPIGQHLPSAIGNSLIRMALGFLAGVPPGIALGVLMGMNRFARNAVLPSFNALRQITLFAWIPLLTGWFGIGDASKYVYIGMSAFFPVALSTFDGVRSLSARHIEVARVLKLPLLARIRLLYLPGALPAILVGVQISLITTWLGTVGAEYAMGNGPGLGSFLVEARDQFRMDLVLAGVFALAITGFLFSFGFRQLCNLLPGARLQIHGGQ